MKVRYIGPFARVEIAVTGQSCEQGGTVEVADALGKSLCEQSVWEPVKSKKERADG